MANLPRRTLGNTGLDVSVLGFGAAPAAYLETEREAAAKVINGLLDAGVNLIDTATSYPGSHEFLGEYLADRRDDYVLVSKVGNLPDGKDWSAKGIAQQVDDALRTMKTDRVDVMLLHSCDLETLKDGEALAALAEARDAGKIGFCGYSGDNETAAYACEMVDVVVVEASVSIADQANIDTVLPLAQKHEVGVIAKRPVANAAWKDLSEQRGFYANYARTYTERLKKMAVTPQSLGLDMDWPELALRFTLSQAGVTTAIIGTTNPEHAKANVEIAKKEPLPEGVVQRLREAFASAAAGENWPGQG